jgi:hypothetical protein
MRPGYYIDHAGDIAIRYPDGTWDVLPLNFNGENPWIKSTQYESMARTQDWLYMGPL